MNMSIGVPVYNEERTIVPVLHRPFIFPKAETIVVDRPVRRRRMVPAMRGIRYVRSAPHKAPKQSGDSTCDFPTRGARRP